MSRSIVFSLLIMLVAAAPYVACAQFGDGGGPAATTDASRNVVLESDRWRQARRMLDEWLSVQQLYTQNEVAQMRQELDKRIAGSSPGELMTLLEEMEGRIAALASPEAADAQLRGPYAPANQMRSPWGGGLDGRPLYSVGPWGAPIHFNPFYSGW